MLVARLLAAAAVALAASLCPVQAQTPPGEIKGVDVMGDKSRSANDGWSQAPVPREQSAAKDAPDPGGKSTGENKSRPVPDAPATASTGTEPQEPMDHRTPGPSGMSPAVPSK
ncbi:hypothetical protein [Methylobacterium trifolii]|uniref:Secreted protein n=1 Tax=Methylobacterium trifolii TaxID=1003092 RepID=A0ABQ4U4J4_9HYPH|nr:hypothetical protein [Methylobacterium trifolii]GJE62320.1 hypothetical protein MPOCJGCO_4453 [Methylobacterium trifolii]